MKYKLLVTDIDDTLLNTKKQISFKVRQAVLNVQKKGALVCIASGRLMYGVLPYAKELKIFEHGGCVMGFNGGEIRNANGVLISSHFLDSKYIAPVYEIIRQYDVTTLVHKNDAIFGDKKVNAYTYVEPEAVGLPLQAVDDLLGFVDWKLHKILVAGEPNILVELETKLKEQFGRELDIYCSAPWFLEVMPKGISKGIGVEKVARACGVELSEVVACGDSFNDISMIRTAGMGVAMNNAEPELKAAANYVTEHDCDHDGLAEVIERFFGDS